MQAAEAVRDLAVKAHRVDEPRGADDAGVGRDEEDRGGEDPNVDLPRGLERAEVQVLDDPEDGIPREAPVCLAGPEQGAVGAIGEFVDGQRGQGDHRQRGIDREDGRDDGTDRLGDRLRLVAGLLGHVRDGLDARIGDHPHGDRHEEVLPAGCHAEVDVVDEDVRGEHERDPDDDK